MSYLLSNALILRGREFLPLRGFLGIRGALIDYIGEERPAASYDTEKNMNGAILIPGLVNAHGHAAMTLLRGVGSGLPLQKWLNDAVFPVEDRLTPDIVRRAFIEGLDGAYISFHRAPAPDGLFRQRHRHQTVDFDTVGAGVCHQIQNVFCIAADVIEDR